MIILNKLNGEEFALNDDLIETIIETPDTTIRLTNGNVYLASQSMREIIEMVANFRGTAFEYAIKSNENLKSYGEITAEEETTSEEETTVEEEIEE